MDSAAGSTQEEAKHLKDTTTQSVGEVAGTAMDQAQQVASDVKEQARKLSEDTKSQMQEQAASQRDKAVSTLRSFGDELSVMADSKGEESSGLATQLAREGSSYTYQVADFLDQREPGQLLDEVREYARRRPGTFLIGAAVAGVVVGRLTRGAVAAKKEPGSSAGASSNGHATSTVTDEQIARTAPPITRSAVEGELSGPATPPASSGITGQPGGTL
jgi:hypothetical protein